MLNIQKKQAENLRSSNMAEEPETASSSTSHQSSVHKNPMDSVTKSQAPKPSSFVADTNGNFQMYPMMYPVLVPGLTPGQDEGQMNRGAGIYAVPVLPNMGQVVSLPFNNLIPLTYSLPTTRASNEAAAIGAEQVRAGQPREGQQIPERQVLVRRFQFPFRLDIMLMLKLAALIFLFGQDGSRQRVAALVFFASIIYLYQTGVLAPLARWLSQGMQRVAAPAPQPQQRVLRADNGPAAARPLDQNAALADGQGGVENEAQPGENLNRADGENENVAEARGGNNGNNPWWGIVKEIQMIVFGFIASLLPGFDNVG